MYAKQYEGIMHPVPWLFTEMLKLNWAPINDKEILIKKVEKRK